MKLEFTLARVNLTSKNTIGVLRNENALICYTLEDKVRPPGEKVFAETAIPAGRYQVRMTYSTRFKKIMPLLMDVPGFSGIRIHGGNTEADTEGCILVGMRKDLDRAVAAAYGWADWETGLTDDQILERLFALNQERAAKQ